MGYNDLSEYPRGMWSAAMDTDHDVANEQFGDTATNMRVAWMIVSNDNPAAQYVNLLDTDDTLLGYIYCPADDSITIHRGFFAHGLKVEMDTNTVDVVVTIAYWDS